MSSRRHGQPVLFRKIAVPAALLQTEEIDLDGSPVLFKYGGDIRIGDLTNNGCVDFVVYRCVAGAKPCFIGAFDIHGEVLWKFGEGGVQPIRPGPVTIHDIDNDGVSEVICCFLDDSMPATESCKNIRILILDGRTGRIKREGAPIALTSSDQVFLGLVRLQVGNFRGLETARDFLINVGSLYLALDENLQVLWSYQFNPAWTQYGRRPAYFPALGDIDGDGRDEVNGGYFLLDHDGAPLWEKQLAPHMDSVAIGEFEPEIMRAFCSGHGHVVDSEGNIIVRLGERAVPHGQEIRVGRLLPEVPGQQMVIRCCGHHPDVVVADHTGTIRNTFQLNKTNNNTGLEIIYWDGPSQPGLLCNGNMLWHASGEVAWQLDGLEQIAGNTKRLRMSWYHCIPADVCGDEREEAILYNPWGATVHVFTPWPLNEAVYRGYHPTPRQQNVRLMN